MVCVREEPQTKTHEGAWLQVTYIDATFACLVSSPRDIEFLSFASSYL
jgi:hypothetical protein